MKPKENSMRKRKISNVHLVRCSICKKNKKRLTRKTNGKTNYRTPMGAKWWVLDICPPCYIRRKRERKRKQKNDLDIYFEAPTYHKHRSCPECNGLLELSRYFACIKCKPDYWTGVPDEFIYEDTNYSPSEMSLLPGCLIIK